MTAIARTRCPNRRVQFDDVSARVLVVAMERQAPADVQVQIYRVTPLPAVPLPYRGTVGRITAVSVNAVDGTEISTNAQGSVQK